jgi:hypothetical protein
MTTLANLRNSILTSVYGRRLGINHRDFLVGPKDLARATQTIEPSSLLSTVSTTGTEILNYGITSLAVATQAATTGSSYGTAELGGVYALAAPEPGVEKLIYTASQHSTMLISVQFSTGVTAFNTSAGSSFGGLSFNAPGQWVRLVGLSTAKWLMAGICTGASLAAT